RDVYIEPVGDMWLGKMTLDPIGGAIFSDELKRLADELFEEDWREARERLGFDPTVSDLARTPGQRRADALEEMAKRSRTAPADGIPPRPLFDVLVDWPTLSGRTCELAQGMALTPGALVPWLDRADFERAVFEPPDRVQVSATARLFTGATRRGIQLRDRECTHPYCDRPAVDCQVDHIQPFGQDGPTTFANGRLLCGYHNRLRHQRPPPQKE
ncbi:MAG TPA: HNH endonuclease signature motif containing protein, partial [Acidimicrobiales bacterium]|nr:HNH endonuclease signature motif containing protein [Acidimicrobiales bacterium]